MCNHTITHRLRDPRNPGRFLYHCACGEAVGFVRYAGKGIAANRKPVPLKPGRGRYEAAKRAIAKVRAA